MARATSPPGLAWLAEALGAPPEPRDGRSRASVVVPSASRPQMVLSPRERGAAWASLRRHSDASPRRVRVAKELMAWAFRVGLAGPLFPTRIPDPMVSGTGSSGWRDLVESVFGRTDLAVAISVGQLRPQIKPILHVATRRGELLGHVKVGWNEVTRPLVRHEAQALTAIGDATRGSEGVVAPRVLHHGLWNGRQVLAVTHVGTSPWYQPPRTDLPTSATRQVGHALGIQRSALGASEFWSDLAQRVGHLVEHAALDGRVAAALAATRDHIESRFTGTELDLGLIHGDWAPWNMASAQSSLAVWDWERSRAQGPIGFDGAYFRFQVDLWMRGMRPHEALDRTLRRLPETMAASGTSETAGPVVLRLVVLEVALRQLEGLVSGVPVPERIYRTLTGLLERAGDEGWRPSATPGAGSPSTATAPVRRAPSRALRTGRTSPR